MLRIPENSYRYKSSYLLRWLMGPCSVIDGLIKVISLGFLSSDLTYLCTIRILENESKESPHERSLDLPR